ncbi:serine hydrolase domain-containing protein [Streptomyces fimicarius]|uniref:serine hydrolase domain-containing protein n=1 Tax=Streptomyces griseus TaxID=1911 RepID=UPI0033227793
MYRKRLTAALVCTTTLAVAFAPAAVMRLVVDRRLRLDDRAGEHVPQPAGQPVTVRQSLKQTSGLPEYTPLVDRSRPGTSEEHLALALAEPPVFGPGEDRGYSNTDYLVLGMVIDQVSGSASVRTSSARSSVRCG